jgi:hypothetical protein
MVGLGLVLCVAKQREFCGSLAQKEVFRHFGVRMGLSVYFQWHRTILPQIPQVSSFFWVPGYLTLAQGGVEAYNQQDETSQQNRSDIYI